MPTITVPDYEGGSLVNLVGEIEQRLTGRRASPGLHDVLAGSIPDAASYVLALFDGLGAAQLHHPRAAELRASMVGTIDAPFPATTTVSLATIATGVAPSRHGLLGYQLWLPEIGLVANTIKWTTLWGAPIEFDTAGLLPEPNLWERMAAAGIEPITVQPEGFAGTPLSKLLYRGCRFEGVATVDEWVTAVVQLSAVPGRFVFGYLPQVDYAAHVYGQDAPDYDKAVGIIDDAWTRLTARLPDGVCAIGTADHGHVDFPPSRQIRLAKSLHDGRTFYGDGRAMFVKGEGASLARDLPVTWFPLEDMLGWWGPGPPHSTFRERAPDGVLVADDDILLLHRFSDDRMIGNHGALTDAERLVPLLIAPRSWS